jgi:hypothetical protein
MFLAKDVEKLKTHISYPLPPFFRKSCRLWDTVEKYDRSRRATDDNIIRRLCVAAWIPKTTDTYSQYVIRTALMQQWLHECAWMLRYAYIAYLVNPLSPELNPICYLLALLAHDFIHVSRIRVKLLTLWLLMSYIYGAPSLDVSRSHTTTHHSR